jgi:hypothetical protein
MNKEKEVAIISLAGCYKKDKTQDPTQLGKGTPKTLKNGTK